MTDLQDRIISVLRDRGRPLTATEVAHALERKGFDHHRSNVDRSLGGLYANHTLERMTDTMLNKGARYWLRERG